MQAGISLSAFRRSGQLLLISVVTLPTQDICKTWGASETYRLARNLLRDPTSGRASRDLRCIQILNKNDGWCAAINSLDRSLNQPIKLNNGPGRGSSKVKNSGHTRCVEFPSDWSNRELKGRQPVRGPRKDSRSHRDFYRCDQRALQEPSGRYLQVQEREQE